MRKQFVVARRLPPQRVPQRVGIDLDQEQSGLAEEVLSAVSATCEGEER